MSTMRTRVRQRGRSQYVDIAEFDPVPCRMRTSMPGKSRIVHPVPGRPDGVDRNTDILVWCECMAQTWDQLDAARRYRAGERVEWPVPRLQRGWDVLGAVSTVLPGTRAQSGSRGRRSNPRSAEQATTMWREHVQERQRRIESRRRR